MVVEVVDQPEPLVFPAPVQVEQALRASSLLKNSIN
jgi:hypothetical protein